MVKQRHLTVYLLSLTIILLFSSLLAPIVSASVSEKDAPLAACLSKEVYSDVNVGGTLNFGNVNKNCPAANDFSIVFFKKDDKQKTYCKIYHNKQKGVAVIAFRGTIKNSVKDWINSLSFAQKTATLGPSQTFNAGKVHVGFYNEYFNDRPELLSKLQDLMKSNKLDKIIFTGHSQGGAIAQIAALDFVLNNPTYSSKISLISFGQPRVGSSEHVGYVNQKVPHIRYVNMFVQAKPNLLGLITSSGNINDKEHDDVVTQVPPTWLNYMHSGRLIELECPFQDEMKCHSMDTYLITI
ncbi:hypothetical protein ABK040_009019 [Willaertia magna]